MADIHDDADPQMKPIMRSIARLRLAGIAKQVKSETGVTMKLVDGKDGKKIYYFMSENRTDERQADYLLGTIAFSMGGTYRNFLKGLRLSGTEDVSKEQESAAKNRRLQLEHQLAEIAAAIELTQHRREGVEAALPDVLAEFQLAVAMPAKQRRGCFLVLPGKVEDDEALDLEPHGEDEAQVLRRGRRLGGVIGRDQAAQRHPAERVHLGEHRVEDDAADILEIDIDALRRLPERARKIASLVIDSGIEAELAGDEGAFLRPAGNADGAGSFYPRDLPDHLADGAGGRRHHHGLAGLDTGDMLRPK